VCGYLRLFVVCVVCNCVWCVCGVCIVCVCVWVCMRISVVVLYLWDLCVCVFECGGVVCV